MLIKIKYLLLGFVLLSISVSAQKNFAVYHISGKVNILSGKKLAVAKRGDVIASNTSLQIKKSASCMLIEENGKSLQISVPGTYTFETVKQMMNSAGNAGVSKKFFSYVYDNLSAAKKEDKLSVTPVVFRGGEDLMKTPLDNTIIISDAFTLEWKPRAAHTPVKIIINNADNVIIDTVLKTASSLQIILEKGTLKHGILYKWKAEDAYTPQPKERYFNFIIAKKEDRRKILKDIKLLQNKSMTRDLKEQLQLDIFLKWKLHYDKENT